MTNIKDALIGALASLAAAISILERTPMAKKAVASNKMFDQMLDDYRKALATGRQSLSQLTAILRARQTEPTND